MGRLASTRVVDEHASQLASGYRAPGLVGVNRIGSIVPVKSEAGKFMNFGPDAAVRRQNMRRELGDERRRIDVRIGTSSFAANEQGLEIPIYDREMRNVVDGMEQAYRDAKTRTVQGAHLLEMELALADILRTAGNYDSNFTTALTSTAQWKDAASTPWKDLRTWIRIAADGFSVDEERLSVGFARKAIDALADHATTTGRLAPRGVEASMEVVAGILNIKSAHILGGKYCSAYNETTPQDSTFTRIYDDEVIVFLDFSEIGPYEAPLWVAIPRVQGYPIITDYRDEPISADIHASDDNWGIVQNSDKKGFLARTVSGLTT